MRLFNTLTKLFLFITLASFFSSCSYMQVKYTFEKDGSGKMEMGAEMGQAMQMIQMMGAMEGENEGNGSGDPMADLFKNMDSQMDTVISFADVMPDSVRGTAEGDAMEEWNLRMTANPETKEMYMAMETNFDKVSEIPEKLNAMEGLSDNAGGSMGMGMGGGSSPVTGDYFNNSDMIFTGKTLKVASFKASEDKELKEMMEDEEADPMMGQMMNNMNLRMVYEVPGKVKKVKYKGPWKIVDDYTVVVEYTMEEFNEIKVFPPMVIKWK